MERSELVKKMVVGLIGIVIFIGGLVACTKLVTNEIKKEIDIISTASLVDDRESTSHKGEANLGNYEKIEFGMGIDEVTLILGQPRSTVKYEIDESEYELVTYSIEGEAVSSITVTLIDGIVVSKRTV